MFKSLLLKGRTLCLLLCCMVSSLVVTAQTKHTGKVIGADDKLPVVGASVRIKGTNTGAVTDVNGDFTLSLSPGNVIVVSYIGYVSQEVTVRGSEFVTISLQPASSSLNEVVVTGYTTQLKKDISGSVAVVDVNDAKKINATSSEQLLQGQAAGVTVVNNGAPGAPSNVYIRGLGNFGTTAPLYVVDGAQVNDMSLINPNDIESISVLKDAGAAAIYGVSGGNGVVVVTTKKGKAGKTTISYDGFYGSQQPLSGNVWHLMTPAEQAVMAFRANDVATEKIYPDPSNATNANAGTLNASNVIIPVYGYHGGAAPGGGFNASGVTSDPSIVNYYHFDAANPGNDFLVQKFATGAGTDWFHSIFKVAPEMQHNITATGGSDKSTFLFSLNYLNQTGTLLNTYEKRYQARLNSNFKVNDHIRFGESGYATYRENEGGYPGSQQQEGGSIAYTYREMPIIPIYDVGGNYGGGYDVLTGEPLGNGSNPYAMAARTAANHARFVYLEGNMFAEADIAKYFTLHTNFGGRLYNQYYNDVTYNTYENYESHGSSNGIDENEQFNSNYNWTNTIQYKQTIGKHNISVLAGYEQKYQTGRYFGASNINLFSLDPAYAQLGDGTVSTAPYTQLQQPKAVESFFGKLDYVYDGKYILGASIRRDGVSVFYPGKQWGTFPSVSLAWRLSQEDFLKGVSWINDLKLRGSYGEAGYFGDVSGNNPYNAYNSGQGASYYGIAGGLSQIQQGFYNSQIGNPNTTWETDKLTNIGLDASLFNHLDLTLEWYKKESSGLLFPATLPNTVGGATAPYVNIGDVQNKGLDISATYHDRVNKDVTFSIGANITTYHSSITKETGLSNYFDSGYNRDNPIVRDQVGHPIGEFFGYQVAGIYQNASQVSSLPGYDGAAPGSFIYKDVDGDGKITPNDRTFIGNPNPNFTYGLNLNASYKRFDFTMVLYGSQGNKDYNYTEYWTDFYSTFQGGKSLSMYNNAAIVSNGVVTNPGATLSAASFSQALGSSTTSSYYVQNGSFLKCRVLQVGYTFDPLMLKSIGFDKLHVYIQANNLFTITKYTGLDPEIVSSIDNNGQGSTNGGGGAPLGIDYGAYPSNQKQYILGVNLTF
ncbi:TonB-dependent receptor [Mucilaginibacter sp.]|uniref:SusC/RagA family TonB-linked outer membrane protein n=1 Tax=Mucilaginibacter sp. TaxID=1882438 RepID=UPI0028440959|nr:TonB-dependent receptor [Mucilaginibacter sp.]MDR3694648.1 TonB-dependent receptor [Mucilaginibacter sp.]